MKAKRGDFGYINNRKKRTLTIAIIYSAISIGIYVLGLVLNHMSRQNLFTVIAVLGVLPIVKQIVGFVVVFPYHSVTEEQYKRSKSFAGEDGTDDRSGDHFFRKDYAFRFFGSR